MDRFRKILVSLDTDDLVTATQCLERASRLAQETGAALRVVDVVRKQSPLYEMIFGHTDADELLAAGKKKCLEDLCQSIHDDRVAVSSTILRGRPFSEIILEAVREQCDLVMRESTGNRISSLEMRLLRNCPVPVWIQNGVYKPCFQRVLAAIDPLPEDDKAKKFNKRILELASSLAKWEDAALHIVATWEIRGEPLLVSKMNEAAFLEHGAAIKRAANEYLHDLLSSLPAPVPKQNIIFKKGDAAYEIRAAAKSIDADVIVMGTLARTGIPGLLMGNTAETVLSQTHRSVLTIKPSDFESPAIVG